MAPERKRAALTAGLGLLLACVVGGCTPAPAASPPAAARGATTEAAPDARKTHAAADSFRSSRGHTALAAPARIRIPVIGVDSTLEQVRRQADDTMGLPVRAAHAAWWQEGPRPGQPGPAVIIGHVDWHRRPAVFFRLDELRPGDIIHIDRADGDTGRFRVTGTRQVTKNRFPTELVYAPSLQPALRLITCGGQFNPAARSYRDNVIVFAVPA